MLFGNCEINIDEMYYYVGKKIWRSFMIILHIQDYFHTQLGYQEYFLSKEHTKLGHEVYVITSDRYKPVIYENNRNIFSKRILKDGFFIESGINVYRLKPLFEHHKGIIFNNLEKIVTELNPDLVIMHGIINIAALRIARLKLKRNTKFRLIFDCHMTYDNYSENLQIFYTLFKKLFSRYIIKS